MILKSLSAGLSARITRPGRLAIEGKYSTLKQAFCHASVVSFGAPNCKGCDQCPWQNVFGCGGQWISARFRIVGVS